MLDEFEHLRAVAAGGFDHGVGGRVGVLFELFAHLPCEFVLVGVDAKSACLPVEPKRQFERPGCLGLAMLRSAASACRRSSLRG